MFSKVQVFYLTIHLYAGEHKKRLGKRRELQFFNNGIKRQYGKSKGRNGCERGAKFEENGEVNRSKETSQACLSSESMPEAKVLRHGVYEEPLSWNMAFINFKFKAPFTLFALRTLAHIAPTYLWIIV